MAGPFDDLVPAQPGGAAAAQAPPQQAYFSDTHLPPTTAQTQYYVGAAKSGEYDKTAPLGTMLNPYGLRPGDEPPRHAYFVDIDGQLKPPGTFALATSAPVPGAPMGSEAGHFHDLVPKPNTALDMLRSLPPGIGKGIAAMQGTGGDMVNFLGPGGGGYHLLLGAAQNLTSSDLGKPYWGRTPNTPDGWDGVSFSHGYGPAQMEHPANWAHHLGLFTSDDGNDALQKTFGAYYKPQTKPGQYVESIAEYAPSALAGENNMQRVLGAVAPGIGSQLGEDVFHSPYGRFAGGAFGLGVSHVGTALARTPQQMMADSLMNTTGDQHQAAMDLMKDAAGRGVHLTFPEAIQQTTGGATGAARLQRVIESTKEGQAELAPMFAARPDQVRGAVMAHADTIAPATNQPSMIGVRAQTAANGALEGVNAQINKMAQPYYDRLPEQRLPPEAYAQLSQDPAYSEALRQVQDDPVLSGLLKVDQPPVRAPQGFTPPPAADPAAAGLDQAMADIRNFRAGQTGSLFSAIRAKGGVRLRGADGSSVAGPDMAPSLDGNRMPGLVNNQTGLSGERMAQSLADEGWFGPNPGDPTEEFSRAFAQEGRGTKVFHPSAYAPDFAQRQQALEQEMAEAGVGAADPHRVAAQKLWEQRNGDQAERDAIQADANRNDPAAAEFDRLSAASAPADPYNNLGNVNRVVQQLDQMAENAAPSAIKPFANRTLSGQYSKARMLADQLAADASEDWTSARSTVANGRATMLEPLQRGPLGKVATTPEVGAQTSALYPSRPLEGAPEETAAAARGLNSQDPSVLPDLTRQHLVNSLNEAAQDNMGGPNQWGGAKWNAGVMGNEEQRAALAAGYTELPEGLEKLDDLQRLSRVLAATGQRLGVGSNTTEKLTDIGNLKISKAGKVFKDFNIAEPLAFAGHMADAAAYQSRVKSMVKMLKATPEEIEKMLGGVRGQDLGKGTLAQMLLQAPVANAAP